MFLCSEQAQTGVGEMHSRSLSLLSTDSASPLCSKSGASFTLLSNSCTFKELQGFVWLWFIVILLCGARWNKASHFVLKWFLYSGSLCNYLLNLNWNKQAMFSLYGLLIWKLDSYLIVCNFFFSRPGALSVIIYIADISYWLHLDKLSTPLYSHSPVYVEDVLLKKKHSLRFSTFYFETWACERKRTNQL